MTDEADQNIEFLLQCFEKIKANPGDPSNYVKRCKSFIKLKHYYYAIEDARKIITDVCPCAPLGYKLLAEIYRDAEIYEEEIKTLESGILKCDKNCSKELVRLKQVAEKNLRERIITERNTFYTFVVLACFLGFMLAMLATRVQYFSTLMSKSLAFVSIIGFTLLLSLLIHWLYSSTKRTGRYFKIHPPYDIIDDNNEIIKAHDRGDFEYAGSKDDSDDENAYYMDADNKNK